MLIGGGIFTLFSAFFSVPDSSIGDHMVWIVGETPSLEYNISINVVVLANATQPEQNMFTVCWDIAIGSGAHPLTVQWSSGLDLTH